MSAGGSIFDTLKVTKNMSNICDMLEVLITVTQSQGVITVTVTQSGIKCTSYLGEAGQGVITITGGHHCPGWGRTVEKRIFLGVQKSTV